MEDNRSIYQCQIIAQEMSDVASVVYASYHHLPLFLLCMRTVCNFRKGVVESKVSDSQGLLRNLRLVCERCNVLKEQEETKRCSEVH